MQSEAIQMLRIIASTGAKADVKFFDASHEQATDDAAVSHSQWIQNYRRVRCDLNLCTFISIELAWKRLSSLSATAFSTTVCMVY